MVFQNDLPPAFVGPIPLPGTQMSRLMLAISMLVDGFIDTNPGRFQRYLANTYLMPHAALVIGGTLCRRPLVLREFADVCQQSDLDGILVRLARHEVPDASFDIQRSESTQMLCAYRLWLSQPAGSAWLNPSLSGLFTDVNLAELRRDRVDIPNEIRLKSWLRVRSDLLTDAKTEAGGSIEGRRVRALAST